MRKIFFCFILVFIYTQSAFAQDKLEAILLVDRPLTPENYIFKVLDLALKNQEIPYNLKIETIPASQPRRVQIVNSSSQNYVIALGSRKEHEEILKPIYVPIQLGLGIGHRIMLTRPDVEDNLKKVKNLDDLSKFIFAQGLGWADVKILRNAGLTVHTPADPTNIPKMLIRDRVDLYPRGLFEIAAEYKRYSADYPDLVIDDYIVLSYPLASFFYVRKDNEKLYNAIKTGLETAYYNGQLQDMIMTDPVYNKTMQEINLGKRIKIEIPIQNISEKALSALKNFTFIPGKKIGEAVRKKRKDTPALQDDM
ncbi:hypothetical protein [Maridesulfovibrio sp.]|uniref:hypothetical protein n=1 Tax=Maridesulfovibrio sp. TaxID=2795000 RepID=UPI0029C9CB93|nr:hypothetical protein [Maridesulfovibrio sp.]